MSAKARGFAGEPVKEGGVAHMFGDKAWIVCGKVAPALDPPDELFWRVGFARRDAQRALAQRRERCLGERAGMIGPASRASARSSAV